MHKHSCTLHCTACIWKHRGKGLVCVFMASFDHRTWTEFCIRTCNGAKLCEVKVFGPCLQLVTRLAGSRVDTTR